MPRAFWYLSSFIEQINANKSDIVSIAADIEQVKRDLIAANASQDVAVERYRLTCIQQYDMLVNRID